jgi:GNAT superfamily N-acetyltransferase
MEGPRAIKKHELPLLESMANTVFRHGEQAPQTMFQEYPDLYDDANCPNIRIITEDGAPVANINYLPQTLVIEGCRIPAATLGGVSTLEDYRGKGYSSLLLADCINRMKEQKLCLLHVSGDRSMYRRAGCQPAGRMLHFDLDASTPFYVDSDIVVRDADDADLFEICRLYNRESVRYDRSMDRMELLLHSRKFLGHPTSERRTLVVQRAGVMEAYAVVLIEKGSGEVGEWAGNKRLVLAAIPLILRTCHLASVHGDILQHEKDVIAFLMQLGCTLMDRRLDGTIKILDFTALMESLDPYFQAHYWRGFLNGLQVDSLPDGIRFRHGAHHLLLSSPSTWNDLIFGGGLDYREMTSDLEIENIQYFQDFFTAVFPLPFVDTGNLSCV